MNDWSAQEDDALLLALEARPAVPVPTDFAARVVARLPQRRALRRPLPFKSTHYGQRAMLASVVLLLLSMLLIAPVARASTVWLLMELALLVQLAAFVLWSGYAASRSR